MEDVPVNGVLCSNNGHVMKEAAVKGLGFALLPTFVAGAELQSGQLVSVLSDWKSPPVYLQLLYPPSRQMAPRIRYFVEFIYERFGGRPYWDLVS